MLSAATVNSSNHHHRQLMMRPDGRCYVFPNSSAGISNGSNSDYDEQPVSRTYQYRKVMKPMLERKRRARINRCLDELKEIMLTALQSEGENVSKLEKADILELTVRHLHKLKRQRALGLTPEAAYPDRFLAGFTHCAAEVSQYLASAVQKNQQQQQHQHQHQPSENEITTATTTVATAAAGGRSPQRVTTDCPSPKSPEPSIDHSSGMKLLQHLGSCIQRIEHATYRREDPFNPYTTPPPSPSPSVPSIIGLENNSIFPASSLPVWRPW